MANTNTSKTLSMNEARAMVRAGRVKRDAVTGTFSVDGYRLRPGFVENVVSSAWVEIVPFLA